MVLSLSQQERRKYFTPRGNHPYMTIGGITYRGPRLRTFRGGAAVRSFGAGAHHVVAVHHDGEVYSWGVGDAGRLGFGDGETGAEGGMGGRGFPTLIKSLRGVRMMEVRCRVDGVSKIRCLTPTLWLGCLWIRTYGCRFHYGTPVCLGLRNAWPGRSWTC